MWLWILIGMNIIIKVHGYNNGYFPNDCRSMLPKHKKKDGSFFDPKDTEPPFDINVVAGKEGEPLTVRLTSRPSASFRGFMLEARRRGTVESSDLVGQFTLLDAKTSRLLHCTDTPGMAVSHKVNRLKTSIEVNWTAPDSDLDITFRATFVQTTGTFWVAVDRDLTLPTTSAPSTTTQSTTDPSTTAPSTTAPSTTDPSTTDPSTTAPSTTAPSTTDPSTTAPSTTDPSTTDPSTIDPSTTDQSTTGTTKTSTTRTTKPSTTRTTKPSTTTIPPTPTTPPPDPRWVRNGTVLMSFEAVVEAISMFITMEWSNVFMTTLSGSYYTPLVTKVSKISCSVLCAAAEILALVLFYLANKVTLVALVSVVIVINFIELVIVSVPMEPSHELKEIFDHAIKLCSVIHMSLTIAVIFDGVLEIGGCPDDRTYQQLVTVMIAYTAWIILFVIWVFIETFFRKRILARSRKMRAKNGVQGWQPRKKELGTGGGIMFTVSVIFVVGILCFSVAVTLEIFKCQ